MEKGSSSSSVKWWLFITGLVALTVVIYTVPWMFWQLQIPVKRHCAEVREEFGGDCVEALLAVIQSEHHSCLEKNQAIWALGQLADRRALPVLRSLRTGVACRRPCHRDLHLCQYEIEKAIRWCERGTVFSRWMRASLLRLEAE